MQLTKIATFNYGKDRNLQPNGKIEIYQVTNNIKSKLTGVMGESLEYKNLITQFCILLAYDAIQIFKELENLIAYEDSEFTFAESEVDKVTKFITKEQYNNLENLWPELLKGLE